MMDGVHVIGAGGIGCAVGYVLRDCGVPVTFVEANPAKIEAGRRDGVKVNDRPALPAEFLHFDDWSPVSGEAVILCTKCYHNPAVLAKLPADACLVPIQNGFDPALDALSHAFEGIASFVSECEPDRPATRLTRRGKLHLGGRMGAGMPPRREPLLRELAAAASPFFPFVMVPEIGPIKHAKLMYNAAISPLAAAAGIDNGRLLSIPAARRLFFDLLQENYRILMAAGIELGKVGPFHPRTVAWILRQKWLSRIMARGFEPSLRGTYCSMAGEIQKGRTEIENYNGYLIRLAKQAGVPCLLNTAVHELVTRMTANREPSRVEVLGELLQ